MASFDQFPGLVCKNCFRPIPLPPAVHPDTSEGQGLWPMGGSRRNFLCPACRHVYEYSAQDIQFQPSQTDPRRANTPYNVVHIRLRCDVPGCAYVFRICSLMPFDKDPPKEAPAMLVSSHAHAITCGRGHILSGSIVSYGLAFDAHFDEDWEIGGANMRRTPKLLCSIGS
jgi:hypothetical protein